MALESVHLCLDPLRPLSLHLILGRSPWRRSFFLHVCGLFHTPSHWGIWEPFCSFFLFVVFRSAKGQSSKVVLGAHSLSKNEASKQMFEVKKFIQFSRLKSDLESDDIMLVKVSSIAFLQCFQHFLYSILQLLNYPHKNFFLALSPCLS